MNKVLAGLALSAGMVVGGSQLAGAALAYPPDPGNEEIFTSVTVVTPGGTVTVTIRGCLVGEPVRFTLGSFSVTVTCVAGGGDTRVVAAPELGTATATLEVPDAPGTYTITALGLVSGFSETATITVAAEDDGNNQGSGSGSDSASGGGSNSGLPSTGSDMNGTVWIAGGALTAGLALSGVALARRRRPAATA